MLTYLSQRIPLSRKQGCPIAKCTLPLKRWEEVQICLRQLSWKGICLRPGWILPLEHLQTQRGSNSSPRTGQEWPGKDTTADYPGSRWGKFRINHADCSFWERFCNCRVSCGCAVRPSCAQL
ncbi:hypothetical protein PoB_007348700 [Plakobranchus ocellatus]|uniref:Uncharacterized protein n=1 Tax=Plakobranchus ocellatus TaxID=259542 RepID=A0AAV4DRP0_9GAST|nr:hypothetical protein PoB_007348700 [Plakobranchus ocellatus]